MFRMPELGISLTKGVHTYYDFIKPFNAGECFKYQKNL